jgi:hypothetical protein
MFVLKTHWRKVFLAVLVDVLSITVGIWGVNELCRGKAEQKPDRSEPLPNTFQRGGGHPLIWVMMLRAFFPLKSLGAIL